MAANYGSDSDQMSDDDLFGNDNVFDLINLREGERIFRDLFGDSDDEEDFDGFDDVYSPPNFQEWVWQKDYNGGAMRDFAEETGPKNIDTEHYSLHRQVSVDEAMIPFKGRLSIKQYMRDRPVKFGVKVWVLADAVTGYCSNFEVYAGKYGTVVDRRLGLSGQVVVTLCKEILGKGHIIFTDNFYTSPTLADYLLLKETYLCGTVRTNRKGYPTVQLPTGRDATRLDRGSIDWVARGDFVATMWKDNRPVYFLSTGFPPEEEGLTTKRRKKDGSREELAVTPAVVEYGKYMGGVDKLDQNTRVNKSKKTMKRYRRVEIKLR
ncbi:piggyBac transposable element-derived protein 4-like [Haliotis cracherodii]|uniref:piggyBac transposable element-derived protein 4-like n=1 Tax=Haliotis cracherodii TaxID=6455 RepID=UPI0039EC3FE8